MPPPDWVVLKFGGTSVSARERWDSVGRIAMARAAQSRVLLVVSALSGVTNQLVALSERHSHAPRMLDDLLQRHRDFAQALGLDADAVIGMHLDRLRRLQDDACADIGSLSWQAEVLAHGELLSSTLGAAYLHAQGLEIGWCDARDWLLAQPQPNQSDWALRLSVNCQHAESDDWRSRFARQPSPILITQGFIAGHPHGGTAILGRGGSDTSAATFGALLQARQVEIWTDVPGMFSANPREVPGARLLAQLDYAEAQEIATTGAKVLHPRSIAPCREARVPMRILDTQRPQLDGTRIGGDAAVVPGVKALSRRNGIVLVSMESVGMWQQVGFLADIFERFRRHGLSVDLIGSSETNVTVSLDPSDNLISTDVLTRLSADLAEVCRVKVIAPCAAITLVGRGMRSLLHRLSDVWATFGRERVHLISQSSNDLNLTFVIDEAEADGLIPELHEELIRSGAMPIDEAEVFGPSWRELCAVQSAPALPEPWWLPQRHRLLQLAAAGTPRYVYHLPTLRRQMAALRAVPAIDRLFYAIKANAHPALLQTLVDGGFGLECVSQGELAHVFAHFPGLDPSRVLFTPSFAPRADYAEALARGVLVTIDNASVLQQWPQLFAGRDVWLRIDLGRGDGHHAKVVTGGIQSKFGLAVADVAAVVALARQIGARITGLHAHMGSGIENPQHWRDCHAELIGIADGIGSVNTLDIGGGLPIPYRADAEPFDLQEWAQGLAAVKAARPDYALVVEPGRFMVAQCGVLLLQATQVVQKQGVRRIGVDAGMNALLRPALYDAWHGIHNLTRPDDAEQAVFDVVGPICESGDVLGTHRRLPAASCEGDVLLLADAGAYGMVMANTYNLRSLLAESILDDTP